MIVMLISNESKKDRQYMVSYAKDFAGRCTEESWKMLTCVSIRELEETVARKVKVDIICVDITVNGALELTKELRQISPSAYIILVASPQISPVKSLMLKPLDEKQIQEVLKEALGAYVERFYRPDGAKVFVLENKGERNLINYENIYFFEAREKRVYLNTDTEEYAFYDTLDELTKRLSDGFIRCHRSFLVNKNKIEKVFLSQNRLVLEEDFEIPLSRSYKPALKEYLMKGEKING